MSEMQGSTESRHDGFYEIRMKGHLDAKWANWFEGMRLTRESDGTTVLDGPVADQAALHGMLRKIRDLGLALISVNQIKKGTNS